jgi:hypothetical protein
MSAIVPARTLTDLEGVIERGLQTFIEVGEALLEIRERRLYRESGYTEFDDYCRERWGWSETYATRNIQAAQVTQALPYGDGPANEAQARELVPLLREDEAAVVEVWRALRERYGEAITAAKVREAVGQRITRSSRPKGYPHLDTRTPTGYLEQAVMVVRYALRGGMSPDEVAHRLVPIIGKGAVGRVLGLEVPEDDEPGEIEVEEVGAANPSDPTLFGGGST